MQNFSIQLEIEKRLNDDVVDDEKRTHLILFISKKNFRSFQLFFHFLTLIKNKTNFYEKYLTMIFFKLSLREEEKAKNLLKLKPKGI